MPSETRSLMLLSIRHLGEVLELTPERRARVSIVASQELALASAATALTALAQQPIAAWNDAQLDLNRIASRFLAGLEYFVTETQHSTRLVGSLTLDHPEQILLVTPRAVESICESLLTLAQVGQLPQNVLRHIACTMFKLCKGQAACRTAIQMLHSLLGPDMEHSGERQPLVPMAHHAVPVSSVTGWSGIASAQEGTEQGES